MSSLLLGTIKGLGYINRAMLALAEARGWDRGGTRQLLRPEAPVRVSMIQGKAGRNATGAALVDDGSRHRLLQYVLSQYLRRCASPRYVPLAKTIFHDEPRKMDHAPSTYSRKSFCLSICPCVSIRMSVCLSTCPSVCLSVCLRTHSRATPTCHTLV